MTDDVEKKPVVVFEIKGPSEAEQRSARHPQWELLHPRFTYEMLGFLPTFLLNNDPRSAMEQFNSHQPGGWNSFKDKWKLLDGDVIMYPGDPALRPLARCVFRDEVILFYSGAFVMIKQKDGTFDIARMS